MSNSGFNLKDLANPRPGRAVDESSVQEPWKPLVFKMPQKKQADGDGFEEVGPEKSSPNLLQGKVMILGELSIVIPVIP